jgi:hypothetical protein
MILSDEQLKAVEGATSGRHQVVLIKGKAGSGKSVVVRAIRDKKHNVLMACHSGIAANNIDGVTVTSLYGVPTTFRINPDLKDTIGLRRKCLMMKYWNRRDKKDKENPYDPAKEAVIRASNFLIIDEIDTLGVDAFDFLDKVCRRAHKKPHTPFGGMTVVLVGDAGQGEPIVKGKEASVLDGFGYRPPYNFRCSRVLQEVQPVVYELTEIFRQTNSTDGFILSRIRSGTQTDDDLKKINMRVRDEAPFGATILAPYLDTVAAQNDKSLGRINLIEEVYIAKKTGTFKKKSEKSLPYPTELRLKLGCRVIIKKNIKRDVAGYPQEVFNGDQGVYMGMDKYKRMIIELDRGVEVVLKKEKTLTGTTVKKKVVEVDGEEVEVDELVQNKSNSFIQYPVRLGYALTIAASQGCTMDRVHVDLTRPIFNNGDLYVALSRVKGSFDNLTISKPITHEDNLVSDGLDNEDGEQWELGI